MTHQSYAEHELHEAIRAAVHRALRGGTLFRMDPATIAAVLRTVAQRLAPDEGPADLDPLEWQD